MYKLLTILIVVSIAFGNSYSCFSQDIINSAQNSLVIRNWTVKDGLPSNSIRKIEKTTDGFLIIASYNGISLFDGKSFSNFGSSNLDFLGSSNIYDFCVDKNGIIWFASQNGVFAFNGNIFYVPEELKPLMDKSVESIKIDKSNRIWIGTTSDGLYLYKDKKIEKVNEIKAFNNSIVSTIFIDNSGLVWIGTESGELYKNDGKKFQKIVTNPITNGISTALQIENGDIYFGMRDGIYLYKNKHLTLFSDKINSINDLKTDRNGILYAATNSGIFYYNEESHDFNPISQNSELKNQIIQCIYFDDKNSLWLGSYRKGLFQLRVGAFENYPFPQFEDIPSSAFEMKNGEIWVSTDEGKIYKLNNSGFSNINLKTNLQGGRIKSLLEDSKGNIWICSYKGLLKIEGSDETLFDQNNSLTDLTIRDIVETQNGNYWISTRQSGIYKIDIQGNIVKTINTSNGLSSNFVMSLTKGKNGKLFIATKRGIDILLNDSIIKHYSTSNGLSENLVYRIYEDNSGVIWVATIKGLSVIKNGKIMVYNKSRGLIENKIYDVVEDNYGNLWMPTINGIVRAKKSDINLLGTANKNIPSELFGKADGMTDPQYVGATKLLKLKNGKIVINTLSGISILDPSIIDSEQTSYVLLIKSIDTEKEKYFTENGKTILPSITKTVQFNYSLLNFTNPDKVELLYKLEPFDSEWQKSGNDHIAKYTNLPAGDYTFKIKATINSKGYTDIQQSVDIEIKPTFFETILFKIIILLLFLLLIWIFYIIRVKTLQHQKDLLEDEVTERTAEILKQKKSIELNIHELEKHKSAIDLKNEEIMVATSNMEQAYLNLRLLSDLGKEITAQLGIEQIINIVYINVSGLMDADLVGIGIYDNQKSTIKFVSSYYRGKKQADIVSELDEKNCLLSYSISNNLEIITTDIKSDYPQFNNTFPKISMFKGIISFIAIPIKLKSKEQGILTVQSFRSSSYSDYHFNLLKNMAVYIGIAIDNSKTYQLLNEQKEELQKVNAAKDKMFSIIGHDLRGPVGTIKTFLDLLIENPEITSWENTLKILKTMQQSLGSAYSLLDNLLVWARNQRGQIDYNPIVFEIFEPVEESISLVLESAKSKNISIKTEFLYGDKVFADKVMITTVLRNIISNAIKFTPNNGQIIIRIEERPLKLNQDHVEEIKIQVIDSGIGIKELDIEKVLKTNENFTTQGTEKEQGSGLGISICLDFLNRHKKQLYIERNDGYNGKPEVGTTFKFYLDKA